MKVARTITASCCPRQQVSIDYEIGDSVSEMLFLHKAFLYRPGGLGALSVLDVGGGYGAGLD